ncbi:glycoside hydrolase family 5 protein [Rickenella mellea]|uniref:Glycoside hydrolase family 5 protein n=1 Tax=Rickenella mellea TaxID=50990 RepID=A0A4Y7PSW3_9AGAM|nr:glycoside hydrolase family 5 protein [Rickenella mellea]
MAKATASSNLASSFVLVDGPALEGQGEDISRQDTVRKSSDQSFYAHDWSRDATGGLQISGRHIVDSYGRVCGLRGANLSGSCKTPVNDDHASFPANAESITFVGRPFPLHEADEHFARLRRWGLTFIRFLVTWEAIEHEGPGKYDHEYLSYLHSILSLLPQYGLIAFISMHQDVWSRYTGGSGAPAWTLTSVGFDLANLEETGAAWLKGVKGGGHTEEERGVWPCGYQKLASSTMWTCFWAGDVFAPKVKIGLDGKGVQEFLQERFLGAWDVLVRAVGHLDGVLGFEMLNEPHRGYIELPSMYAFDYNTELHLSHVPSALESFALGAGHTLSAPYWTRSFPMPTKLTSYKPLNTNKMIAWRKDGPTGGKCVWELHNVWGWDRTKEEAVVLRENYFTKDPMTGRKIDWYTDFYYPFLNKWAERVRAACGEDKIVFAEAIPNEFCPSSWKVNKPANMVHAPHWYDLNALFRKAFGNFSVNVQDLSRGVFPLKAFYWGQQGARDNFSLQIGNIVKESYEKLGEVPVIIGECGVPMDMNRGQAFKTADWQWQAKMMDAMITGLERSLIGYTLWNYNPHNDDITGDDWNGENFSWFSLSRARTLPRLASSPAKSPLPESQPPQSNTSLDEGGRILRSIVRPYPAKVAGVPIRFEYEMNTGAFVFEWKNGNESISADLHGKDASLTDVAGPPGHDKTWQSEIFVPALLTGGRKVAVRGIPEGTYRFDEGTQTLFIYTEDRKAGMRHRIDVSLDPPLKRVFAVNHFWGDMWPWTFAILFALFAVIFTFVHAV